MRKNPSQAREFHFEEESPVKEFVSENVISNKRQKKTTAQGHLEHWRVRVIKEKHNIFYRRRHR